MDLFKLWLQVIANKNLEKYASELEIYHRYRVCGKHFLPDDYCPNGRLKKTAIPKLNLRSSEPVDDIDRHDNNYMQQSTSTAVLIKSPTNRKGYGRKDFLVKLSPMGKRLHQDNRKLNCRISDLLKTQLNLKKKLMTPKMISVVGNFSDTVQDFILNQIKNFGKSPKARRFTVNTKILCLCIWKQSACAYKLLANILFNWPSIKTLRDILGRATVTTGIHHEVMESLRIRGQNMTKHQKTCVLMFDEMSIMPHLELNSKSGIVEGFVDYGDSREHHIAKHAQVFMLRSVTGHWKQPVAYKFVQNCLCKGH